MSPVTHGLATLGTLLASAITAVTLAGILSTFAVLTGWSVLRSFNLLEIPGDASAVDRIFRLVVATLGWV